MPQMDSIMFAAQALFIFVFLIGYILFIKLILPIVGFEIKLKQLLPLHLLNWFDKHQKRLYTPYSFLELMLFNQVKRLLVSFTPYLKHVNIRYSGVYYNDFLYLRSKYKKKKNNMRF